MSHSPLTPESLPVSYFIDPTHYAVERERVLPGHWIPVARREDLSQPGSYLTIEHAVINERTWRGMHSLDATLGPLSRYEEGVKRFRHRLLAALAEPDSV